MAHYNENKNIKILVSVLRTQQVELEDSINIMYGILDQIFKVWDNEDVRVKQIIPYLDTLSKKTENDTAKIKKPHGFMKKTKN